MPLIQVVLVLIMVGVLLWVINQFVPMDGKNIVDVGPVLATKEER